MKIQNDIILQTSGNHFVPMKFMHINFNITFANMDCNVVESAHKLDNMIVGVFHIHYSLTIPSPFVTSNSNENNNKINVVFMLNHLCLTYSTICSMGLKC
jgi:hypothetical protein